MPACLLRTLRPVSGFRVSPAAFRRVAVADIAVLVAIVVSGAIVRLTDSGLGCANWPNCSDTKFVDVASGHSAIEQINRIFSGLILIPLLLTLIAAYRRTPRRRDLVQLSWTLLILFLGEAVLGGISVIVKLAWFSVMGHFLLAIALLGVALVLHQRAREQEGPRRVVVTRSVALLTWLVYTLTIWVLVWGTLVTATGPHGGDAEARRLGYPLRDVARVHSISVDVLVGFVLVLVVALVRTHAPPRVLGAASIAIVVMTAQGVLGYLQYFNEIPALLVGFHVFGAVLTFICVQQLVLELRIPHQEIARENRTARDNRVVMSRA
jgi:heme a synthase